MTTAHDLPALAELARHLFEHSAFEVYAASPKGDFEAGLHFLERHFLVSEEEIVARELRSAVFHTDRWLPEMVFRPGFQFLIFLGGGMFDEAFWQGLQSALQKIGEPELFIFQDEWHLDAAALPYQLKVRFPVRATWEELMAGDFVSTVLFERFHDDFQVFGRSGKWGVYVTNEYHVPGPELGGEMWIVGFQPELAPVFRQAFGFTEQQIFEDLSAIPPEERTDLQAVVPEVYLSVSG